jgi:GNAT superfamily N-acetyltransferase
MRLTLKPVGAADEALVDEVFAGLTAYSLAVDGVPRIAGAGARFLTERPPETDVARKHVFAIMHGPDAIGLIDLIADYPRPGTGFLGLLAITEPFQRRGFGRESFQLIEDFARRLGLTRLRIAVVDTNPVHGFWEAVGFARTGETASYRGEVAVTLMERAV